MDLSQRSLGRRDVAAVGLMFAALLAACSSPSPSDAEYAELVQIAEPQITNISVGFVKKKQGNWTSVTGRAQLADDMFRELNHIELGEACDASLQAARAVRGPLGPDRTLLVVEAGPMAGSAARFELGLLPTKVEAGDVDYEGNPYNPEKLSTGGWHAAAPQFDYSVDGIPGDELGHPADFFGGIDEAIFTGTTAFDELCEAIRAVEN